MVKRKIGVGEQEWARASLPYAIDFVVFFKINLRNIVFAYSIPKKTNHDIILVIIHPYTYLNVVFFT